MRGQRIFQLTFWIVAAMFLGGCKACTEQHDPSADKAAFREERLLANRPIAKLSAKGELPEPKKEEGSPVAMSPIEKKYQQLCVACHGADGAAAGPAAQAMNPKPRNFTDSKWQDTVADASIAKIIKDGGPSMGMSPMMAAWSSMLSDGEIDEMVKLVRGFRK